MYYIEKFILLYKTIIIYYYIKDKKIKRAKLQTVFKYKDKFIWGYYDSTRKYYAFYQFEPN